MGIFSQAFEICRKPRWHYNQYTTYERTGTTLVRWPAGNTKKINRILFSNLTKVLLGNNICRASSKTTPSDQNILAQILLVIKKDWPLSWGENMPNSHFPTKTTPLKWPFGQRVGVCGKGSKCKWRPCTEGLLDLESATNQNTKKT